MMDRETWLKKLLTTARQISSREFQQRTWFGAGDEVSSPIELYESFFDDCTAALFYEQFSKGFADQQVEKWDDFVKCLEEYGRKMPDNPDPKQVFDDPDWERVRKSALNFVRAFE